jgi:hypothetical protein
MGEAKAQEIGKPKRGYDQPYARRNIIRACEHADAYFKEQQ